MRLSRQPIETKTIALCPGLLSSYVETPSARAATSIIAYFQRAPRDVTRSDRAGNRVLQFFMLDGRGFPIQKADRRTGALA
jgi:hypothetical protein